MDPLLKANHSSHYGWIPCITDGAAFGYARLSIRIRIERGVKIRQALFGLHLT